MDSHEEKHGEQDRGYYRVLSELSTRGFLQSITKECPSISFLLDGLEARWPELRSMRAPDRYATLISDIADFASPEELKNSQQWRFVLADRISAQHETKADAFKAAKQLQRNIRQHNSSFPPFVPPPPEEPKKKKNDNAKRKRTIDQTLEAHREEIRETIAELTPQLQLRLLRSLVREYNGKKKEKKE